MIRTICKRIKEKTNKHGLVTLLQPIKKKKKKQQFHLCLSYNHHTSIKATTVPPGAFFGFVWLSNKNGLLDRYPLFHLLPLFLFEHTTGPSKAHAGMHTEVH